MKHKLRNAIKWLVCGILAVLVSAVCFNLENAYNVHLNYLIYGSGVVAVVCFISSMMSLLDKKADPGEPLGTMIIEEVFPHADKGCVVVGDVQGTMAVGTKVTVTDQSGQSFRTTIKQMEHLKESVEIVTDSPAALFLKHVSPEEIGKGDVVRYEG